MKTLEDYQNRLNHIERYCKTQISKKENILKKYPNNIKETVELKAYKDILFKLTYEK